MPDDHDRRFVWRGIDVTDPARSSLESPASGAAGGRRQGSLGRAIFVAVLIVIAASFVVAPLEIGELYKGITVAVVAAVGGGLLARLRGPLRWLVVLILPTVIVWGAVLAAIAFVVLLLPCGGFICD